MAIKCEGYLIAKTGICAGHYPYRETKEDLDKFFLDKQVGTFKDYSVVRADPILTKNINVANIHVDLPHNKTTDIDYVSFKNSNDDRWWHAQVYNREIVNEKSTRLFVLIDYVATYWDQLELMPCLIERTHISEAEEEDYTNPVNFLDEPFPVTCNFQDKLTKKDNYFEKDWINGLMDFDNSSFCITSSVGVDGSFKNPKFTFQCGVGAGGYTYTGTMSELEQILSTYTLYTSTALNKGTSMYEFLQNSYILPSKFTEDSITTKKMYGANFNLLKEFVDLDFIKTLGIKHKKVLNYLSYQIVSGENTVLLTREAVGLNPHMVIEGIGGKGGCMRINIWRENINYNMHAPTLNVTTPQWASVTIAGSPEKYSFRTNKKADTSTASNNARNYYANLGKKLNGGY